MLNEVRKTCIAVKTSVHCYYGYFDAVTLLLQQHFDFIQINFFRHIFVFAFKDLPLSAADNLSLMPKACQ